MSPVFIGPLLKLIAQIKYLQGKIRDGYEVVPWGERVGWPLSDILLWRDQRRELKLHAVFYIFNAVKIDHPWHKENLIFDRRLNPSSSNLSFA